VQVRFDLVLDPAKRGNRPGRVDCPPHPRRNYDGWCPIAKPTRGGLCLTVAVVAQFDVGFGPVNDGGPCGFGVTGEPDNCHDSVRLV
jgi:hypothetical protein